MPVLQVHGASLNYKVRNFGWMSWKRTVKGRLCFCCNPPSVPLFAPALQSPIEYQRRESQTNSLGRPGGPGVGSPGRIRPGDRAQLSTHTPINGSLPSLLLSPKGAVARAPLRLDTQVWGMKFPGCKGRMGRASLSVPGPQTPISFLSSTTFLLSVPSYFPSLALPDSSLTLGEADGLRWSEISGKRAWLD